MNTRQAPVARPAVQRPVPPEGRVAIVTGGSSGIGRAVAQALVEAGVRVTVVGTTPERLQATTERLRDAAGGDTNVLPLMLDVREETQMARMVEETLGRFGQVDLLVAAAGITRAPKSTKLMPYPVAQLPMVEWESIVATNLRGTFLANRAVLPTMINQRNGTIINVSSSPAGYQGQPFAAAYCASKFGVRGLTQALAEEVLAFGIRVEAIFPDAIDTPMLDRSTLANRLGDPLPPSRVADLVMMMWTLPQDVSVAEPVLMPARRPSCDAPARRPPEGR
jgi:NAD(P)-dependent dehydrogenase (short-subunit alcohol dehydrogenase family)